MRNHLWLFNLYSKSLQKSGLFYGFPSPQKLQKLYVKTIKRQSLEMDKRLQLFNTKSEVNVLLISCGKVEFDRMSIESLVDSGKFTKISFISQDQNVKEKLKRQFSEIVSEFEQQTFDVFTPLLVLNGGDILHSQAVDMFLSFLSLDSSTVLYCDTDCLDKAKNRHSAEFYPDWNPDLLLASGYIKTGIMITGEELLSNFYRFSNNINSQMLVALWLSECYLKNVAIHVEHLSFCLIHRNLNNKTQWHQDLQLLSGSGRGISICRGEESHVAKLMWNVADTPLVSLIIPTKNAKDLVKTCIESIVHKTTYTNYEILLIDNNSDDKDAITYFHYLDKIMSRVRVLKYPFNFNYSAINNFAVKHAKGKVVGLINNDIEVISPDWLEYMVSHALREDIGCVGAKLLYPDNRIQHAGVVMGYGGGAGHAHKYFPRYHSGYLNRLITSHNYSAVTAACLVVKKADYLAVGGLNEIDLTVAFNDVDFCLRILQLGRRNLFCAEAVLYHHESISRGKDDTVEKRQRFERELEFLQTNWKYYIEHDPAYNSNLTLRHENFSIRD